MSSSDLIVYSVIAALAVAPAIKPALSWAYGLVSGAAPTLPAQPPHQSDTVEVVWRQKWSATLITFIESIEDGEGHLEDEAKAARLARELIWEIIGGDGQQAGKK
jgi:hypothetical protein